MKPLLLSLLILAVAITISGQDDRFNELSKRARDGDVQAVFEIGRSGNPKAIDALLPLYYEPGFTLKREARMALAAAGDRDSLQYFACQSLTGNVRRIDKLMAEDLEYIGGEFAAQVYRQLLDSDQRFSEDMNRADSDALLRFPSSDAVVMLAKLFPDGGVRKPTALEMQAGRDHDVKMRWITWIDQHEDEIRKLKPSAEGVVFESSYCSDYGISTAMDERLRALAGEGATDCGRVEVNESAETSDKCVKKEFGSKKPFLVRYDVHEIDEEVAVGLAADQDSTMYAIAFDDVGVSTYKLGEKSEVMDGGRGVVVTCPKPTSLKQSVSRGLTCLSVSGNSLLSPK